jgi:hypothetical protein
VAGTPVLMADGTWKAVELVQVGDFVMTTEGPAEVWDYEYPVLGSRRLMRFEGDESGLAWSEEHPVWARRDGKQWWWTAGLEAYLHEVAVGRASGLLDNRSMMAGDEGVEFAHIDALNGFRAARVVPVEGASASTLLYFPKTRGSQTLILGSGWVFSGGINEFTYDYNLIDWKGLPR